MTYLICPLPSGKNETSASTTVMKSFVSVSRYSELWKPVYFPMPKVETAQIANIHAALRKHAHSGDILET